MQHSEPRRARRRSQCHRPRRRVRQRHQHAARRGPRAPGLAAEIVPEVISVRDWFGCPRSPP